MFFSRRNKVRLQFPFTKQANDEIHVALTFSIHNWIDARPTKEGWYWLKAKDKRHWLKAILYS